MKLLLVLLFPLCAFSQLPAGKYLKVKDDASGFELVTLNAITSTINIKSFGASTANPDNRAAIIAARDYIYSNPVTAHTLFIPTGTYQVSDSIKFDKQIRIVGEGTTSDVYLDLKNSTGKSARINYSTNDLRIYTKDDSLGVTINDVGVTAKKFFGEVDALNDSAAQLNANSSLIYQALN